MRIFDCKQDNINLTSLFDAQCSLNMSHSEWPKCSRSFQCERNQNINETHKSQRLMRLDAFCRIWYLADVGSVCDGTSSKHTSIKCRWQCQWTAKSHNASISNPIVHHRCITLITNCMRRQCHFAAIRKFNWLILEDAHSKMVKRITHVPHKESLSFFFARPPPIHQLWVLCHCHSAGAVIVVRHFSNVCNVCHEYPYEKFGASNVTRRQQMLRMGMCARTHVITFIIIIINIIPVNESNGSRWQRTERRPEVTVWEWSRASFGWHFQFHVRRSGLRFFLLVRSTFLMPRLHVITYHLRLSTSANERVSSPTQLNECSDRGKLTNNQPTQIPDQMAVQNVYALHTTHTSSHRGQPGTKKKKKHRLSLHLNFMKLIYSLIKCELFKKIQTDSWCQSIECG